MYRSCRLRLMHAALSPETAGERRVEPVYYVRGRKAV